MANNRMYLREKHTGEQILLCKYYPGTGWYLFHKEEDLNNWFESVRNKTAEDIRIKYDYMWGPTSFELVFEIVEDGGNEAEL